jgi:hypothetical protein
MNPRFLFARHTGALILLVISAIPFVLCYFLAEPGLRLLKNGVRTEGIITAMVLVDEPNSAGYAATVVFKDALGRSHEIERPFITADPIGSVGDSVGVYYLTDEPADARVDHWFHLWGWAMVPGVAGVVLLLAAITELFRRRPQAE